MSLGLFHTSRACGGVVQVAFRKLLAIALIACILLVGGLAQAQAAEHAGHHAKHQAATHGTILCSWMCAAGTVLDSEIVLIQTHRVPIALTSPLNFNNLFPEPARICSSRAPPSSFL